MRNDPEDVAIAEARKQVARQQLFATLDDMKARLSPSTIAHDALESATDGARAAARKGVAAVRARPLATAAVASAIGLVVARGWIGRKLAERRARHETGR